MFLLTDRDLDVRKYWRSDKIKVLPVQNNGHRKSQNKYSQNGACASNKLKQKLIAKNLHILQILHPTNSMIDDSQ